LRRELRKLVHHRGELLHHWSDGGNYRHRSAAPAHLIELATQRGKLRTRLIVQGYAKLKLLLFSHRSTIRYLV
jgi:hypothetical protein